MKNLENPILDVLSGKTVKPCPIWMMRQAGRHLPEYMTIRKTTGTFIDFCLTPEKGARVTLQPVERYDMDAAILFADILLVPLAMGRRVDFIKDKGPDLDPLTPEDIGALTPDMSTVENVFESVRLVRNELDISKALIGFCGGAWTVATYMIEGCGTLTKERAKRFALKHPETTEILLNRLADFSAEYMIEQAKAGADVLKIFESWAEGLNPYMFEFLVIRPTQRMIGRIRDSGITVPVIGFPRGSGLNVHAFVEQVDIDALAVGTDVYLPTQRRSLPRALPLQGNLDPLLLRMGGQVLKDGVSRLLGEIDGPHIFNLGHGISPDVKIQNVQAVVDHVRTGHGDYAAGEMS